MSVLMRKCEMYRKLHGKILGDFGTEERRYSNAFWKKFVEI
jgi:hypothetical protein